MVVQYRLVQMDPVCGRLVKFSRIWYHMCSLACYKVLVLAHIGSECADEVVYSISLFS